MKATGLLGRCAGHAACRVKRYRTELLADVHGADSLIDLPCEALTYPRAVLSPTALNRCAISTRRVAVRQSLVWGPEVRIIPAARSSCSPKVTGITKLLVFVSSNIRRPAANWCDIEPRRTPVSAIQRYERAPSWTLVVEKPLPTRYGRQSRRLANGLPTRLRSPVPLYCARPKPRPRWSHLRTPACRLGRQRNQDRCADR